MTNTFAKLVPELPVADVAAAQAYYRDLLGFRIDWIWDDDFGSVTNADVQIFFTKQEVPTAGVALYIFVDDADEVYTACVQAGVEIIEPLASTPWGMREFVIRDLNGHRLRIGHGEKSTHQIERFHSGSLNS